MTTAARAFITATFVLLGAAAAAQEVSETITVSRMILDVRVIDEKGRPIRNLKPADFRVRVGAKPATVVAAEWNDEAGGDPVVAAEPELADEERGEEAAPAPEPQLPPPPKGRTFVFFFQNDFARENVRVTGHMKILGTIDRLIGQLQPDDRVAVFSFDSHLRFWLDLESDKKKIAEAVSHTMEITEPPAPPLVPEPSLTRALKRDALRAVAKPEQALALVADALARMPGRKSLVFFSWGLGHRIKGGVSMGPDYEPLQQALANARTSLFSIDMTQSGHDLALGLRAAAEDSGGFYASANGYVPDVYNALATTLSGYYELEVRVPAGSKGDEPVVVDIPKNRYARVLNISAF